MPVMLVVVSSESRSMLSSAYLAGTTPPLTRCAITTTHLHTPVLPDRIETTPD
jgi:hypothetical protein